MRRVLKINRPKTKKKVTAIRSAVIRHVGPRTEIPLERRARWKESPRPESQRKHDRGTLLDLEKKKRGRLGQLVILASKRGRSSFTQKRLGTFPLEKEVQVVGHMTKEKKSVVDKDSFYKRDAAPLARGRSDLVREENSTRGAGRGSALENPRTRKPTRKEARSLILRRRRPRLARWGHGGGLLFSCPMERRPGHWGHQKLSRGREPPTRGDGSSQKPPEREPGQCCVVGESSWPTHCF